VAFELYDTFGFPIDLTRLIGTEQGWTVDEEGFAKALQAQKDRSRADAKKESGDWHEIQHVDRVEFIGYDEEQVEGAVVVKHRTVKVKDKEVYHLVLDKTPFYAESGGQVGDKGVLMIGDEEIKVIDTQKENDLIIHYVDKLPKDPSAAVSGKIVSRRRGLIQNNHTATHLMHAALREVLGGHVQQRGSLVNDSQLRFDFSHFEKMSEEQIKKVEKIVNQRIQQNISLGEARNIPIDQAKESGATMLFGEKYGDYVRMITFDPEFSVELCGGCHVAATGQIGLFKIKGESAIAAGVRRIEAVTAESALGYTDNLISELQEVKSLFKNPTQLSKQVADLLAANKSLEKELASYKAKEAVGMKDELIKEIVEIGGYKVLTKKLSGIDMEGMKTLAYSIEQRVGDVILMFGLDAGEKANLQLLISKALVNDDLNAGQIIREVSKHIQGGGGGQPFFASAGGKNPKGISAALEELKNKISALA